MECRRWMAIAVTLAALLVGAGCDDEKGPRPVPDPSTDLEVVRARLRDRDFDPDAKLLELAGVGDTRAVELLLERATNGLVTDGESERSALHEAAAEGHVGVCRALTRKAKARRVLRTLLGARDARGRTALHDAALGGHVAVARLLIQQGSVVDAGGRDGRRPLHLATLKGNAAMVDELVRGGAHILARDAKGRTARQYAAALRNTQIVRALDRAADAQWNSLPVRAIRDCVNAYVDAQRWGSAAAVGVRCTKEHREALGSSLEPARFRHRIEDVERHEDEARAIVRLHLEGVDLPVLLYAFLRRKSGTWLVSSTNIVVRDRWEEYR